MGSPRRREARRDAADHQLRHVPAEQRQRALLLWGEGAVFWGGEDWARSVGGLCGEEGDAVGGGGAVVGAEFGMNCLTANPVLFR